LPHLPLRIQAIEGTRQTERKKERQIEEEEESLGEEEKDNVANKLS
jgi:hypothetical protein